MKYTKTLLVLSALWLVGCDTQPVSSRSTGWEYITKIDKMRGETRHTALNVSNSNLDGAAPLAAVLEVAHYDQIDRDQMPVVLLNGGVIVCDWGCEIAVKIDQGKVETMFGFLADCAYGATCIAIRRYREKPAKGPEFRQSLYTAKSVIIELPIYGRSRLQYTFDFPEPIKRP